MGKLNIDKISIISKLIYRLNTSPIKVLTDIFVEKKNVILKFRGVARGPNSQNNLETEQNWRTHNS